MYHRPSSSSSRPNKETFSVHWNVWLAGKINPNESECLYAETESETGWIELRQHVVRFDNDSFDAAAAIVSPRWRPFLCLLQQFHFSKK